MRFTRGVRAFFGAATGLVLVFLYLPLSMILLLSFNTATSLSFPPKGLTLKWWSRALDNHGARDAFWNSVQVAFWATLVALVLGTLASLAVQRYRFFGRNTLSLVIVLPIALPGIVTGIALNAAFRQVGIPFGMLTLIIAHATFCIVVLYNNSLARLRRMSPNLEEASADLGAGVFTTFRLVTFPMLRSSLLAGGLLAFGLSFDEIVVTTFTAGVREQTLPIWIFQNMFRPNQAPVVNVVAAVLVLSSIIPIWLAQRLSGSGETMTTAR